ncbi:MAG: hypothetical protein V1926_00415 [Candidatus Peregrinibacteria bacterium]
MAQINTPDNSKEPLTQEEIKTIDSLPDQIGMMWVYQNVNQVFPDTPLPQQCRLQAMQHKIDAFFKERSPQETTLELLKKALKSGGTTASKPDSINGQIRTQQKILDDIDHREMIVFREAMDRLRGHNDNRFSDFKSILAERNLQNQPLKELEELKRNISAQYSTALKPFLLTEKRILQTILRYERVKGGDQQDTGLIERTGKRLQELELEEESLVRLGKALHDAITKAKETAERTERESAEKLLP